MELENLLNALIGLPPSSWRDAALSALRAPGMAFAGSHGSKRTSTTQEFLELYQFRLEHTRKHCIEVTGLEDLVAALRGRSSDARIHGEPFQGPVSVVYAFWDDRELIGCITSNDKGFGKQSLAFAMGEQP